jgi:hypothetical protein
MRHDNKAWGKRGEFIAPGVPQSSRMMSGQASGVYYATRSDPCYPVESLKL